MAKDSLLKEVDDALRWQRVEQLWARAGRQIILFASLAIISLIALLLYKQQQEAQAQAQSDALLKRLTAAQETLDATELTGAFAQIQQLALARQNWQQGESTASKDALSNAQQQPEGDELLKAYACLQQQLAYGSEDASCTQGSDAFTSLLLEPRVLDALTQQGADAAFALLPPAAPEMTRAKEPARLAMLRAYLRSRTSAPPQTDEPNDAAPEPAAP